MAASAREAGEPHAGLEGALVRVEAAQRAVHHAAPGREVHGGVAEEGDLVHGACRRGDRA